MLNRMFVLVAEILNRMQRDDLVVPCCVLDHYVFLS